MHCRLLDVGPTGLHTVSIRSWAGAVFMLPQLIWLPSEMMSALYMASSVQDGFARALSQACAVPAAEIDAAQQALVKKGRRASSNAEVGNAI